MNARVAINGFGRMGRLVCREIFDRMNYKIVHINEPFASVKTSAHLLEFDSIHGRWQQEIICDTSSIRINDDTITYSQEEDIDFAWDRYDVDIVLECSGKFRNKDYLATYFKHKVKKVIVSAPVNDVLNIVYGINDDLYNPAENHIITSASCTTNCLAPLIKVIQEKIGICHGQITTIHDATNTQVVVDAPCKDLRRARASSLSLIPTTTNSAKAITMIYPELKGRLNSIAVRVPLLNASLVDCVFELNREVSKEEVNSLFEEASNSYLKGILGYEEKPLVSIDYKDDKRSVIIDALSTTLVDKTSLKVLGWYDNEIGYVNRMAELCNKVITLL